VYIFLRVLNSVASVPGGKDFTYLSVGIHGQSAGFGSDILIFDDTLRRISEAASEKVQRKLWSDVKSSALSRHRHASAVASF
jgi:hypothetical protein